MSNPPVSLSHGMRHMWRTRFIVEERVRSGRPIWFLLIETEPGVWREWLLPKSPPLKPGIRRIAIERPPAKTPDAGATHWDAGPCTIQDAREDRWVVDFGGRQLFGVYMLLRTRPEHWLLFGHDGRAVGSVRFALSAGGVVIHAGSDAAADTVALIKPFGKRYWTLPKGTVEPDEGLEAAALREVREETGAIARVIATLDPIEYWFWSNDDGPRERVHKAVASFLMQADQIGPRSADEEVEFLEWATLDTAPARVTHESEREVLEQGIAAWKAHRQGLVAVARRADFG